MTEEEGKEKVEITRDQLAELYQCWWSFNSVVDVLRRTDGEFSVYQTLVPLDDKMSSLFDDLPSCPTREERQHV